MTVSPRPVIAALAAGAALVAAGCGEKKDTTTGSGAASSAPQTVTVRETEYRIAPADPGIKKAGTVKFEIRNTGKRTHALVVEGPGGEQKSKPIAPGKSTTLTATLKPGSYQWYCPIDGHKRKGMKGKFTVAKSAGGTTTTPGGKDDKGGGSRYY